MLEKKAVCDARLRKLKKTKEIKAIEKDKVCLVEQKCSTVEVKKYSIKITTNLEFSKWNKIFYDEKITAAIIDV